MKRLFALLLAVPAFAFAQDKTVINVSRVFPKPDKVKQFEKALAEHVKKFHKGDYAWRVSTIESGPDAGGYSCVEGPNTWDAVDTRGDLNKEHQADWDTNIQPLLTDRSSVLFATYRADLSTVPLTEYSDKYAVTHIFYRAGYGDETEDIIKSYKKMWEQREQSVAVYEASSSGEPQYIIVTRYKMGLKEREVGFRPSMSATFAKFGGESAWRKVQDQIKQAVDHSWSEMLYTKKELSSH